MQRRRLRVLVDRLDKILVLGDGFQPVRLRRGLRAPRPPRRRRQRQVRIGVHLRQIKFQLRRHDGAKPRLIVKLHHPPQHVTRRDVVRFAIGVVSIGEDKRGRRLVTRRRTDRIDVRPQHDIWVLHGNFFVRFVGVLARHSKQIDARRNAQRSIALALQEFLRGEDLPANNPIEVGNEALDLADAAFFDPVRKTHDTHMLSRTQQRVAPRRRARTATEILSNGRGAKKPCGPLRTARKPRPFAFFRRLRERVSHLMNHYPGSPQGKSRRHTSSCKRRFVHFLRARSACCS